MSNMDIQPFFLLIVNRLVRHQSLAPREHSFCWIAYDKCVRVSVLLKTAGHIPIFLPRGSPGRLQYHDAVVMPLDFHNCIKADGAKRPFVSEFFLET